jgi:xanthine dehydrogenase YagR molybdenum-binding subunit
MADAKQTRIGDGAARIDGRLKVTGQADFPSDVPVANPAYAWLVTSAIARGRITGFDLSAAQAVPGYLDILTFQNTPGVKPQPGFTGGRQGKTLDDDQVEHDGQIIAMVLADSFEAAREAAYKVKVAYAAETPAAGFDSPGVTVRDRTEFDKRFHAPHKGDAAAAFAAAPVKVEAEYETPIQHHNQLELQTTTVVWSGGKLTVHEPSQFVMARTYLAESLGMKPEDIRVVSHFIGGGFGGKGSGTPRTVLAAIAAKRLNRPVKLMATRDQGYTIGTYRAETRHAVKLAADRSGKLLAYQHDGQEVTSRAANYSVGGVQTTGIFYNYPAVSSSVKVVNADRNMPGFMRSPAEIPYMFALESAMDELAYALKMDPVALRKLNDVTHDPIDNRPYTSRSLSKCLDAAAERFGWSRRNPEPRSTRDGDWLVGWGMASACYPSHIGASAARVALRPDGSVKVQLAFHELGTGAYTVVGQVAADKLGLPLSKVTVELGDTDLPPATIAAGSIGTASVCSAVALACEKIRTQLAAAVTAPGAGALAGADPAAVTCAGGELRGSTGAVPLQKAVAQVGGMIEAIGEQAPPGTPPGAIQRLAMGIPTFAGGVHSPTFVGMAHGANFVEVRVHARTGEIRTPRMVGAFAAGTIVNERTARSQLMGGMIWGVGAALHEATEIDRRTARYTNDNLADYLIPVNADIQQVDVLFVPETETQLNPMGIKGVGELGNVGMNAAVANAVFHATGRRIRRLPIRMEDLI